MWQTKVLVQFILAKLPGGERANHLLQLLNASYSAERSAKHVTDYSQRIKHISEHVTLQDSTVVEVGTGWDLRSALIFYLMGAKAIHTYDHLPHVRFKLVQQILNQMAIQVDQMQAILSVPNSILTARLKKLQSATDLQQLLAIAGIHYHAPGDATETGLPDHSVDLVYSYAVLEHVPENVIDELTVESKRILKENGVVFHGIGLHDHYVAADKSISKVNFLKYSERKWSFFVKNSISYHNRLRERQFLEVFSSHGATVLEKRSDIDPSDIDVLKGMKIDERFRGMTLEELAVHYSEVVMTF